MKQGCKLWGGEKRERVLIIHVGERFWEGKKGDIMKMQTFLLSLSLKSRIAIYEHNITGVYVSARNIGRLIHFSRILIYT